MSPELITAINAKLEENNHPAEKMAAVAIGLGYMASTFGDIARQQWEGGQAGLNFFRWAYYLLSGYQMPTALREELLEIIKDYQD